MKKYSFVTMLCASLMCLGLFSCEKDGMVTEEPVSENPIPEPEPEPAHYVDIVYTLNCSEDLLKYLVPQVTYIGDDGQEVTLRIADSEWEVNEDVDFDVALGDGFSSRAKILKWTRQIRREKFPVDDGMVVSYVRKTEMPAYGKTSINLFYNDLSINYYLVDEEKGIARLVKDELGDVSYTLDETKEELFDFVECTGRAYFMGTNGANLIIGAGHEMIEEVVNLYWRKVTFYVDDNGSVSLFVKIAGGDE